MTSTEIILRDYVFRGLPVLTSFRVKKDKIEVDIISESNINLFDKAKLLKEVSVYTYLRIRKLRNLGLTVKINKFINKKISSFVIYNTEEEMLGLLKLHNII